MLCMKLCRECSKEQQELCTLEGEIRRNFSDNKDYKKHGMFNFEGLVEYLKEIKKIVYNTNYDYKEIRYYINELQKKVKDFEIELEEQRNGDLDYCVYVDSVFKTKFSTRSEAESYII